MLKRYKLLLEIKQVWFKEQARYWLICPPKKRARELINPLAAKEHIGWRFDV